LGDDLPNDELNVATKAGLHFGYRTATRARSKIRSSVTRRRAETRRPGRLMGPHVASIGMRVLHGHDVSGGVSQRHLPSPTTESWNRSEPIWLIA
jgi:glucose/arabinose dehydrogenase